jgi:hypothetical protein
VADEQEFLCALCGFFFAAFAVKSFLTAKGAKKS